MYLVPYFILSSKQAYAVTIILLTFQIRNLTFRECKQLAHDHTAGEWQNWDSNPSQPDAVTSQIPTLPSVATGQQLLILWFQNLWTSLPHMEVQSFNRSSVHSGFPEYTFRFPLVA